jgi:hypothetical protein
MAMEWYSRRFPVGRQALDGLQRLRSLRKIVTDGNVEDEFYLIGLDTKTLEVVVFIKPGNQNLAMSFKAESCPAPAFGQALRDISVSGSSDQRDTRK